MPILHTGLVMESTTGCSGSFFGKKGGFVLYTEFPSASADISEFEEHDRNVVVRVQLVFVGSAGDQPYSCIHFKQVIYH